MSVYSFQVSILGRSGRSGKAGNAVASAAYISRQRLTDDRTGTIYDYRREGGIEFEGIYTPKDAPKWMQDRETLWNAVEEREDESSRPDNAQLARRFIIAVPHELDQQQRLWLVKDFAREFARKGMVVDFAIHTPDKEGDQRNYHAHMMLTMREVYENSFGNKVREWNARENIPAWRERWAELGAKALERAGHPLEAERFRHAHLSLEMQKEPARARGDHEFARDLDRKPTPHLGPTVKAMDRDGKETEKADRHNRVVEENERRAAEKKRERGVFQTPENSRGIPKEIWEAYNWCSSPKDFIDILNAKGLHLARISERDLSGQIPKDPMKRWNETPEQGQHEKRMERWAQKADVGRYVVLSKTGDFGHLVDQRTTGHIAPDIEKFMAKLDPTAVKGVEATRKDIFMERTLDNRPRGGRLPMAPRGPDSRIVERVPFKIMEQTFDAISNAVDSILSPVETPERKYQSDRSRAERQAIAEEAELRRRQDIERDRGGRDR